MCGKRPYDSPHAVRWANRRNSKRIRVYLCPMCHAWHATTQKINRRTPRPPTDTRPNIEPE